MPHQPDPQGQDEHRWQPPPAQGPAGQVPPGYYFPPEPPGKTLGIVAAVLPFVGLGLIGLVLGIVARSQSSKVGYRNVPALVGIIAGAVTVVIGLIVGIAVAVVLAGVFGQCAQLGPGVHHVNGITITCG
ncbi:DUF4190 domain-containing protein [Sinomonas flava]|uniref:DUF4190 domain-containing protein n=1 Tax=Sinomonas flava TaxID=496857 RepID=A0ABN3BH54_9MICC